MTEMLFYHLQGSSLESALPPLLEKSLKRGWRAAVQMSSEERIAALDAHLWTYHDDSFLPHGTAGDRDAGEQPILLTLDEDNQNQAHVRFLIDGVDLPQDAGEYDRVVVLFDGGDPDAVAGARGRWQDAKAKGFEATYWQQSAEGRWERQG
jgi:DNA polymerase III subunit chi